MHHPNTPKLSIIAAKYGRLEPQAGRRAEHLSSKSISAQNTRLVPSQVPRADSFTQHKRKALLYRNKQRKPLLRRLRSSACTGVLRCRTSAFCVNRVSPGLLQVGCTSEEYALLRSPTPRASRHPQEGQQASPRRLPQASPQQRARAQAQRRIRRDPC